MKTKNPKQSVGNDVWVGKYIRKTFDQGDYVGLIASYNNPYYKVIFSIATYFAEFF